MRDRWWWWWKKEKLQQSNSLTMSTLKLMRQGSLVNCLADNAASISPEYQTGQIRPNWLALANVLSNYLTVSLKTIKFRLVVIFLIPVSSQKKSFFIILLSSDIVNNTDLSNKIQKYINNWESFWSRSLWYYYCFDIQMRRQFT